MTLEPPTCNCSNCLVPAKKQRETISSLATQLSVHRDILFTLDKRITEALKTIELLCQKGEDLTVRVADLASAFDRLQDDLMREDTEPASEEEETPLIDLEDE